jgi:hypothetical protein
LSAVAETAKAAEELVRDEFESEGRDRYTWAAAKEEYNFYLQTFEVGEVYGDNIPGLPLDGGWKGMHDYFREAAGDHTFSRNEILKHTHCSDMKNSRLTVVVSHIELDDGNSTLFDELKAAEANIFLDVRSKYPSVKGLRIERFEERHLRLWNAEEFFRGFNLLPAEVE